MKHLLIALLVVGSVFTACHLTGSVAYASAPHDMTSEMNDMENMNEANECNCNFNQNSYKLIKGLPTNNDLEDDLIESLSIGIIKYTLSPLINSNNPPVLSNDEGYYESQFFKNIHSVRQDK